MENNNEEKNKVKVKLEKHLWPDEVKEKKKIKRSMIVTVVVFSIVFLIMGVFLGKDLFSTTSQAMENTKLNQIQEIMEEDWYFGKDIENLEEKINDQAIKGLSDFPDYDIHTYYLTKEDMEQFTSNLSGSYVGIGIQFYESENNNLIVKRVFDDSPAQKSGILAGDILLKVDNTSLEGMDLDEVANLVLGKEDSLLTITVSREGKEQRFELKRAKVLYSTFARTIDNVGYIELDQFGESTSQEVLNHLNKFENKQDKLILDLRDNGGGYLNTVVDIGSYLIDKDEIILITENNKGKQIPEYSNNGKKFDFEDIVVLVNENTASASEVLTAALSYHLDNVTVVGVNTYGKGTVQQSKVFTDGSAMKYTIAEWLTPDGQKINKVGIKPDVEVKLHPILSEPFAIIEEGQVFEYDSVGLPIATAQKVLDFLGYDIKRQDGYFDKSFEQALLKYQKDNNLETSAILDEKMYDILLSKTIREWNENTDQYDRQLERAVKLLDD